jgi:hypothetical protein
MVPVQALRWQWWTILSGLSLACPLSSDNRAIRRGDIPALAGRWETAWYLLIWHSTSLEMQPPPPGPGSEPPTEFSVSQCHNHPNLAMLYIKRPGSSNSPDQCSAVHIGRPVNHLLTPSVCPLNVVLRVSPALGSLHPIKVHQQTILMLASLSMSS